MLTLDGLRIAVLTVPRTPCYIHKTLGSIFASGAEIYKVPPCDLIVDTSDINYLEMYQNLAGVKLHYLSATEEADQKQRYICSRFCYGYWRCLSLPVRGGLLVLEDDVIVRDRFLRCLLDSVNEIEDVHGITRYVLAVHSRTDLTQTPCFHRGKYFVAYPAGSFCGTQGMYYPSSIIPELRDFLFQHGVEHYRLPGDLLIREVVEAQQNIYKTAWDLVEHIGDVSTGLGGAPQSGSFRQKWRPLIQTG